MNLVNIMKCTKCLCDKDEDQFYKKVKAFGKQKMTQCKECHKERMRKRTRNAAQIIFDIVGNSCSACGYNKCSAALELHHLNPSEKEFNLSKSRSYSLDKIKSEIHKCVLLCANCHREVHSGLLNLNIQVNNSNG